MNFITDRIAIGSRRDAMDLELIISNGIGAVLNLAYDLDISYFDFFDIWYVSFVIIITF